MGGLADDAFDQQDFVHRPADRRDLLRAQAIAAIVDRQMRLGHGAEHQRRAPFQQMADQRRLNRARFGQRRTSAQRHCLAAFDAVERQREGLRIETVQRGHHRRQPFGRRMIEIEQRQQRDVKQVGAAPEIVARQGGDPRAHRGRRRGHDVERVAGAHGGDVAGRAMRRYAGGKGRAGGDASMMRLPTESHTCARVE